ncbi:MAG: phosphoglycerate kinase [Desulfarculaceae bacterium]|nr:phosphoglycerate kinase [Desulfarculaceae bacterium]MCF8074115.1 phosphoglycerate kinase [Desulfarculaceae bacterium]MCF8103293.1 phosphoglycerate kinase [Desulfarculaceae bacterium]MCF8116849.1 phosphoglycerate kinase [Desulfarculaceae bacterium]
MQLGSLDDRLPLVQQAKLKDKVVLVRFDHNVVKKGVITDPFRIDRTLGTLFYIVAQGGRPIMMTHVGRPKDKKTGAISTGPESAVEPIVAYLESKLHSRIAVPGFPAGDGGIAAIDTSINHHIRHLRNGEIDGIYLPNTRWFAGEEAGGEVREEFALQLAGLADIYVNDAFGSWQPHASTFDVTRYLPSYAGWLLQDEMRHLEMVLNPDRPFVAVVAGAKYDTKIGPLSAIYDQVDHLILGGVIYNTYLCAKYGVKIAGVAEEDIAAARELVEADAEAGKIVELPLLVESEVLGREEGKHHTVAVADLKQGQEMGYVLDIDPASFDDPAVAEVLGSAATIFVNAVMGFTPHFTDGSRALDTTIDANRDAAKLYGGGDTLQEFKDLCPGLYLSVLDNAQYYFFTGGGSVLKAIEQRSPYGLEPVAALIDNARRNNHNGAPEE